MDQVLDQNFEFDINLAGVKPFVPGQAIEPGFYQTKCTNYGVTEVNTGKGPAKKAVFTFDFDGVTRSMDAWLPGDPTATADQIENNRKAWRGIMESAGFNDAQIGSGTVRLNRATFIGATMHVEIRKEAAKDGSDKQYDRVYAWAASEWAKGKAAFERAKAAGSGSAATASAAPTGNGSALSAAAVRATPSVTAPTAAPVAAPTLSTAALLSSLQRPTAQG